MLPSSTDQYGVVSHKTIILTLFLFVIFIRSAVQFNHVCSCVLVFCSFLDAILFSETVRWRRCRSPRVDKIQVCTVNIANILRKRRWEKLSKLERNGSSAFSLGALRYV
jgi:hypothetical protein